MYSGYIDPTAGEAAREEVTEEGAPVDVLEMTRRARRMSRGDGRDEKEGDTHEAGSSEHRSGPGVSKSFLSIQGDRGRWKERGLAHPRGDS